MGTIREIILLMIFLPIMMISSCTNRLSTMSLYTEGAVVEDYSPTRMHKMHGRVDADRFIFDKEEVGLDFSFGLYSLDKVSFENNKNSHSYMEWDEEEEYLICVKTGFAVYLSKNATLGFEKNADGSLVDFRNNVNAELYKYISYEDAFDTNYGYTCPGYDPISYNYSEALTIPAEMFDPSSEHVYIHIVQMEYYPDGKYYHNDKCTYTIDISYSMIGDNIVVLTK